MANCKGGMFLVSLLLLDLYYISFNDYLIFQSHLSFVYVPLRRKASSL